MPTRRPAPRLLRPAPPSLKSRLPPVRSTGPWRSNQSFPRRLGPRQASPAANLTTTATPPSVPGPRALTQSGSRDVPVETGRVWVKVPRSYYYHVSILTNHKEPPLEELQKLVGRTEEQIKTGIALVVPLSGASAWKTTIDMIPDELPLQRSPVVATASDARRIAIDWAVAGAMGAIAATLVMFGSWMVISRRPVCCAGDGTPQVALP